jgi:hypothetical protein
MTTIPNNILNQADFFMVIAPVPDPVRKINSTNLAPRTAETDITTANPHSTPDFNKMRDSQEG